MLSKEELLRNIDELYRAYFSAESQRKKSEAERSRLRSLNSMLRKEIAKLSKPRDISELNEKISALEKELSERPTLAEFEAVKSKLEAEIDTLKSTLIAPIS